MPDYIEKEAALKTLYDADAITMRGVILLSKFPAVNVAPVVHGRWEEQDYIWSEAWKCSACGEEWCFEHDPTEATTRVNYCPNCGAKMDLGD